MSILTDYENYDGLGLAALVRNGDVKAEELLDAAVARANAHNPDINAIVLDLIDEAREQIVAGLPEGPFRGVPFLIKDLHAKVKGAATTNGCSMFVDDLAPYDSELVARYRRAGLAIFGKSNTPEFGLSVSTEPRLFGACRSPWNLDMTTGGSSGGAAAAVAAGILPVAHASDGGGSIRIPASCCGLFGLKPSRGRTPMGPDSGEGWSGMSAQHVVSVSVRDSAAMLDATHGPAVGDPYYASPVERSFLSETESEPGRLRIAMAPAPFTDVDLDPECAAAASEAARLCEELGHEVVEDQPPIDVDLLRKSTGAIIGAQTYCVVSQRAAALGRELKQQDVEPITWNLVQMGANASGADYVEAVRGIHTLGRSMGDFFERYDVLLTPTMAQPPVPIGILDMMSTDTIGYLKALLSFTTYTQIFNATGQPAMSVPLAQSKSGLPIGIQFAASMGDEGTLIRLAAQLERAHPWRDRLPKLEV